MAVTFAEFVADQVARCEALPGRSNYTYSEAAQIEICNWLESRAGEKYDAIKQSTLHWLQDSTGARRVKAVIDDVMEGDLAPTVADIRSVWERLHGAHKPVNYDCPDCGGLGFTVRVSSTGAEGAARCPRGCAVPAPTFEAHPPPTEADKEATSAWASEADAELRAKLAKPMDPPRGPLPPLRNPLTEEDIKKARRESR